MAGGFHQGAQAELRRMQSLFCCDSCTPPTSPLRTLSFSRVSFFVAVKVHERFLGGGGGGILRSDGPRVTSHDIFCVDGGVRCWIRMLGCGRPCSDLERRWRCEVTVLVWCSVEGMREERVGSSGLRSAAVRLFCGDAGARARLESCHRTRWRWRGDQR